MSLSLSEIRTLANQTFDALEAGGTQALQSNSGQYWRLDSTEAWDLSRTPEAMVGDLREDIGDLHADVTSADHSTGLVAWHTLDHLIGVLTALSHQVNPQNSLVHKEAL